MPKKKTTSKQKLTSEPQLAPLSFPIIQPKEYLDVNAPLEDQVLIIQDFFSPLECKEFVKFIDTQVPLSLTPAAKRGEADRVNCWYNDNLNIETTIQRSVTLSMPDRFSVTSPEFAEHLFQLILPHLPPLPPPKWGKFCEPRRPHGMNKNIRLYKYTPQQYFGPHYDDSVRDADTGMRSEWTLLVYLTGIEDGVEGGKTIFYTDEKKGEKGDFVAPTLSRGSALLHRHGAECLLHEGSQVTKGVKYVLRSDLMFLQ